MLYEVYLGNLLKLATVQAGEGACEEEYLHWI